MERSPEMTRDATPPPQFRDGGCGPARSVSIQPFAISVIIATRNRAALLDQTLSHLAGQSLPKDRFEVIVADNGSDDTTPAVIDKWKARLPLTSVTEPMAGKNRALNRALPMARGELFVFTDDDVIPAPNWLEELDGAARRWPDDAIFGGPIRPRFPDATPKFIRDHEFPFAVYAFGWFELDAPEGPMTTRPFGANLAIRRHVFDQYKYCETIGPAGKNYAMGSESELLKRLTATGMRIIHVPTARVEHVIESHQVTLEWLKSRAYRAGRGRARMFEGSAVNLLWSVPRHLWRKCLNAWLRSTIGRFASPRTRWCTALDYYSVRGMIAELRELNHVRRISADPRA
jgi:glycosyltransferase involved in cell wall biosynthesis